MKNLIKTVLSIGLGMLIITVIFHGISAMVFDYTRDEATLPAYREPTKAEYIDIATDGCSKDGSSTRSFCRCFYTGYLENHTVSHVMALDKEAVTNPDTFKPNTEQLKIANKCSE